MQIKSKHLAPEQIAVSADALRNDQYALLTEDIKEHLKNCNDCAEEVINVAEISFHFSGFDELQTLDHTSPKIKKKIKPAIYRKLYIGLSAAAAILLIAFTTFFYSPYFNIGQSSVADKEQESTANDNHLAESDEEEEKENETFFGSKKEN